MPARHKAYLALITTAIIWGAALPIVKPALDSVTAFQFLFLRYAFTTMLMFPLIIKVIINISTSTNHELRFIFTSAILTCISLSFLYVGLAQTTAIESSLIGTTSPIILTLLGIVLLKEHEERNEWLGLFLSVLGTLVIILLPYLKSGQSEGISYVGNALVFIAVLIDSFSLLIIKHFSPTTDRITITVINVLVASVFFALANALMGTLPSFSNIFIPEVMLAVTYMSLLGTAIAFTLLFYGFQKIEASEATLFRYLQPLVYIPLSIIWLQEPFIPMQLAGLLLIVAGVGIAELRPRTKT